MPTQTPWYKKKRYIIPLSIFALFIAIGISSNNSQPSVGMAPVVIAPIQSQNAVAVPKISSPSSSIEKPIIHDTFQSTQDGLLNNNYYTNSQGDSVHSPAYSNSVPVGATAKCGDGTYSFSENHRGTCSHHGGVTVWY